MRFRARSQKGRLLGVIALFATIILTIFFANIEKRDAVAEVSEHINENSELTYYLKVSQDGIDSDGVISDDNTKLDIAGNDIHVTDRIPDGLIFESFVTTDSAIIGAALRGDPSVSCGGSVVDDTNEATDSTGTWNDEHTEYYWHGLHYSEETRTVSFTVTGVQAGCEVTVGINTRTPVLPEGVLRMDFYNSANAISGTIDKTSNIVHNYITRNNAGTYNVEYAYDGDVPQGAPALPEPFEYIEGDTVTLYNEPSLQGYIFSGWQIAGDDAPAITNGAFVMPGRDVQIVGHFDEVPKYKVTYRVDGGAPSAYTLPSERSYVEGADVEVDGLSQGETIEDWVFNGYTSSDTDITSGTFSMPNHDVVIVASFTQNEYTVSYEYTGDVPANAPALPEAHKYHKYDFVQVAEKPTLPGYVFYGWSTEDFYMDESDVVITGSFAKDNVYFAPKINKKIIDPKEFYRKDDVVKFEITVENTAEFDIINVVVQELLDGVTFIEGENYAIRSPSISAIDRIPAGGTAVLYSEFTVKEDKDAHFDSAVIIADAAAENGDAFDNSYSRASVGFDAKTTRIIPDINPETLDGIARSFVILAACGAVVFIVITIHRKLDRRRIVVLRKVLVVFSVSSVAMFAAMTIMHKVSAYYSVPTSQVTYESEDLELGQAGYWRINTTAELVGQDTVEIKSSIQLDQQRSANPRDVLIILGDSCIPRAGADDGSIIGKMGSIYWQIARHAIGDILSANEENRVGVISYDAGNVLRKTAFSRDENELKDATSSIPGLSPTACYAGFELERQGTVTLKAAEDYLEQYQPIEGRELYIVYLSDEYHWLSDVYYDGESYHSEHYERQYRLYGIEHDILKEKYPNLTINSVIAYSNFNDDSLRPDSRAAMVRQIGDYRAAASDNTYICRPDSSYRGVMVVLKSGMMPTYELYDGKNYFDGVTMEQALDTRYFGTFLGGENVRMSDDGSNKLTWSFVKERGNYSASAKFKLKEDYEEREDETYPIFANTVATVDMHYPGANGGTIVRETIESNDTPAVKTKYKLNYDYNLPDGCELPDDAVLTETVNAFSYKTFAEPVSCPGWEFESYAPRSEATVSGRTSITMPQADVTLKGSWSTMNIAKSNEGTVHSTDRAYLVDGPTFRRHVAALFSSEDKYVTEEWGVSSSVLKMGTLERASSVPDYVVTGGKRYIISTDDSPLPVYMWISNGTGCPTYNNPSYYEACLTFSYYTLAKNIFMNEDSSSMFAEMEMLTDISSVSDWNASEVKNMSHFFDGAKKLADISPLEGWRTPKLEDFSYACYRAYSLKDLTGLEGLASENLTNLDHAFADTYNKTTDLVDFSPISGWDVSKVKNMNSAFENSRLESTEALANWRPESLESLRSAFASTKITDVDGLADWPVPNLTDMQSTFSGSLITNVDGLSEWSPSVTNLKQTFSNTSKLTNVDGLAKFNTDNITELEETFYGSSIENVNGLSGWNTSNVTDLIRTFASTKSLNNIEGLSGWNTGSVVSLNGTFKESAVSNLLPLSNWNVTNLKYLYDTFEGTKNLTNLAGLNSWQTVSLTGMEGAFSESGITNVDALASWDVSKVVSMHSTFSSTHELENIDGLSDWKTTSLERIYWLFSNSGITNVDALADWDVSKVSSLDWVFVGDEKLTNINGLASWDVSSVTYMEGTFQDTPALTSLEPLSSWAPTLSSYQKALRATFYNSGVTSLKGIENFDVSQVTKLERTFSNMKNLKTLGGVEDDGQGGTKKVGLKGWEDETGNITCYIEVFAYDTAIEDLSAVTGWIVPNVTSTSGVGSFYQVPKTATDYYLVPFRHL